MKAAEITTKGKINLLELKFTNVYTSRKSLLAKLNDK